MLVLSRKQDEKILFPHLGIEVDIQRISGKSVKIGINAPKSVRILRGELAGELSGEATPGGDLANRDAAGSDRDAKELRHAMRNQLHQAQLAVSIAQKQLQKGKAQDAEETLQDLLTRLSKIDKQLGTPEESSKNPPSLPRKKPRRALVVEDDANERALMAAFLELSGFEISEAADGVEAMEFLSEHSVDLVVLDMRMPRMNGLETAQEIRRCSSMRNTKVVVVSGEDREEAVVTGDHRGVTEWFCKPLDANRFASFLDATLN